MPGSAVASASVHGEPHPVATASDAAPLEIMVCLRLNAIATTVASSDGPR
jgi:hypothetical protein